MSLDLLIAYKAPTSRLESILPWVGIDFETPGGPDGDVTTLAYGISQRNKDRWNYLLGFNWDLNKSWSVTAEAGFGGSRENFIGVVTYRF